MKWTKEQQEAIEIRDKNILVSAAAGSGKTAVLVERIRSLIVGDQVPLDSMLIVTFSNAAASEMREKIVGAISKEMEKAEGSGTPADRRTETRQQSVKAAFLREQLNLIHRANISTFHAFSMEVIRRYFYFIDIEPNFKICDEAQKTILQAEAMEQLFSALFESGSQDFIDFLRKFAITKNDNAAKDMIFEVHNFIQSIPSSFDWLKERTEQLCCPPEAFKESLAFQEIRGEIERLLALAKNSFARAGEILEDYGLAGLHGKWKLEMDAVEALHRDFKTLSFDEFGRMAAEIKYQTYAAAAAEKETYEEIKKSVTALRNRGKDAVKRLISHFFVRPLPAYVEDLNKTYKDALYLCYLVAEFDRIYKEKKKGKGLIDFSDIEHYALDILSHEEAAAEYRNKFDYIFIDEYQDSNIVQETLIGKIKRENNLFMVGDVKQSIYKFRLAEPEIFIGKYEAFRQNKNVKDIKLDLNKNFRSKGKIIDAVNDLFRQIMGKELSGLEYDDDAALYPGQQSELDIEYPVEMEIIDELQIDDLEIDDEINEMKKAEIEAYTATRIIRETQGRMVYDRKRGEERLITNKDIVILLRSAKGYAEIYYEALMKEGIPAFVDNSDGYFDTLEVEVFLNLLRMIDNRKQDIPLLSVLRSSLFGFTIEEMIQIRLFDKDCAYHKVFMKYAEQGKDDRLREKCFLAQEKIGHWKRQAALMPLEDFLWMLIRETGYYEYIGGIPGGSQRQANLRALVDKAVQFQSSQMKGLFSFINYIEAIKKRNVPMGQVRLVGENDDVVRIMTIHKSKGLEFPVVLVGGLGKRFNTESDTPQISLHKDIGLGLRFVDKENSCYKKTILQTAIEQKKKREGLAEELRILYVAFTRAMDRLILLGTLKDVDAVMENYKLRGNDFSNARSYLDFIVPALEMTQIIYRKTNRKDISFRKEETANQKREIQRLIMETADISNEIPRELQEEVDRRLSYDYKHKEALKLKSKFTVSELGKVTADGSRGTTLPVLDTPKFLREKSSFTGAEKGTILHKVMEHLDFRQMADVNIEAYDNDPEAAVKAVVKDMTGRELLTAEEAKVVAYDKIMGFFDSKIGRRACRSRNLYKEVSFNIMKEMSGENIIIQGTIDCYFEEDGKYILLDYKSNYIADPEDESEINRLADNYRLQLDLYREALERIRGIKVEEAWLYLFGIGKGVRIT